jgi:hypothetical protein
VGGFLFSGGIVDVRLISKEPFITVNPTVLIGGDGRTLIDDVGRFNAFSVPYDVYSIGRSVKFFDAIDHWGNVDAAESIWWAEHLPDKWRTKPQRHTLGEMRGFDFDWEIPQDDYDFKDLLWHGSTALFCVYTSLAMGYERVVLAGCPLDSNGHWYFGPEVKGPKWPAETYRAWLDFKATPESQKVRSFSGYTRTILGEPDREWLSGGTHSGSGPGIHTISTSVVDLFKGPLS